MKFGYLKRNKNTRWPLPTLHVFEGVQSRSHCGKIAIDNRHLVFSEEVPSTLVTVCEHCVYGRPNLQAKIYDTKIYKED